MQRQNARLTELTLLLLLTDVHIPSVLSPLLLRCFVGIYLHRSVRILFSRTETYLSFMCRSAGAKMSLFESLNDDILAFILPFVSPLDAMRLAKTCRVAYSYAMPRFLSEVILGADGRLKSGLEQVAIFCSFMLADTPRRTSLMKSLKIMKLVDQDTRSLGRYLALLARVLHDAVHLERIAIEGAGPLFDGHPGIVRAVASLPRLQEISLDGGARTLECVSELRSSPQRVTLHFNHDIDEDDLDICPLKSIPKSIQILSLTDWIGVLKGLDDGKVFPSVRTLEVAGYIELSANVYTGCSIQLPALSRLFPNVEHVRFGPCVQSTSQAYYSGINWPNLDHAEFLSGGFETFPLSVRRLSLYYEPTTCQCSHMARNPPVVLSYRLPAFSTRNDKMWGVLRGFKYLELELAQFAPSVPSVARNQNLTSWLVPYLSSLRGSPLMAILVRLDTQFGNKGFTPISFVTEIAFALPHLNYVGISFGDTSDMSASWEDIASEVLPMWYRLTTTSSTQVPQLEELSPLDGKTIQHQLRNTPRA